MTQALVLGRRALREGMRTPEAIVPTLFIPLFFLVVNVGQAAKIFPGSTTAFLHGQGYGAFQLPSSMLLAASFGSAALFLVEEIEGGYFDKLRATPVHRSALVLGRLIAEGVKSLLLASLLVLLGLVFGITIASGPLGFVLLIVLTALWAVVYTGFMQVIALKTRSAAATNSAGLVFFPLLFLTTQYLEEADQLCDRLAIIDDGRIVREGTPPRLKAELRERLGLAREATLDDVFLDATGRTRTHVAGEVQEVSA